MTLRTRWAGGPPLVFYETSAREAIMEDPDVMGLVTDRVTSAGARLAAHFGLAAHFAHGALGLAKDTELDLALLRASRNS